MSRDRYRKGIALVWVAIFGLVLVGVIGLSLDWGKSVLNVHQLHNGADAAALAGAQVVKFDQVHARQMAITIAGENRAENRSVSVIDNVANDPNGEVVLGRWIRQMREFIPTLLSPNAVKVVGRRRGQRAEAPPLSLVWGPAFNTNTVAVSRHAIAMSIGTTGAGILTLAADPASLPGWPWDTGLLVPGNGTIDLRGTDPATGKAIVGDMQDNSESDTSPWDSFRANGDSADLYVGELNSVGTTNPDADDAGAWEALYGDPTEPFSVNPYSPRIEDPLIGIVPPDLSTMPAGTDTNGKVYGNGDTITGGTLTLNPGYYPAGIDMSGGTITLNPGVYAFGGGTKRNNGPGLVVNGGTLTGHAVMLYITGDPTGGATGTKTEYGRIDIGGNAALDIISRGDALNPPEINGEMGVAIWQDRANDNFGSIIGGGTSNIVGTIYCGYNAMQVGGNFGQMGNQLIAGALELNGGIDLGIAYDGRNAVEGYRSILVE